MRQAPTLEQFKLNPQKEHALTVCFDYRTGGALGKNYSNNAYDERQQLQLDAIANYLIILCEMIDSGLDLIFSSTEVSFVQNLVYYIERAYRTPDFGMWGRGSKHNCGTPELSASSVGSVRAALGAIDGFNLYGKDLEGLTFLFHDFFFRNF